MILRAGLVWLMLAGAAMAQTDEIIMVPLDDLESGVGEDAEAPIDPFAEHTVEESEERVTAATGTGAVVRALDKVSGMRTDLEIASGESAGFGRLSILLSECRYPADNPEGDAYAQLVVFYEGQDEPVFAGWMVASSPALSAMDHRRYDVWVLRCTMDAPEGNSDG